MKHIKSISEAWDITDSLARTQLRKLGRTPQVGKWCEPTHDNGYREKVRDLVVTAAMEDAGCDAEDKDALERLEGVVINLMEQRIEELEVIVGGSECKKFRPQYAAEIAYHTLCQGRVQALKERDWTNGGFKKNR